MELVDPHGRKISYLRLSVTDRCNLRCSYCMPAAGVPKLDHRDILSYEELLRVARAALTLGVEKIRITGGEPLIRPGLTGFLAQLARLEGLRKLVLTTNGILLPEMAVELREAGVESLNISLDSLSAETFSRITRGGVLARALEGIAAAEAAGFPFVKLNVVVMRGINDGEVGDFATLTLDKPCRVRFIEYMPTQADPDWCERSVTGDEILARLGSRYRLEPVERESMAGPARYYRIAGAAGMIGIITPVSCHFCNDCNRIRVTSTGFAKSCLLAGTGLDLKPLLRDGNDDAIAGALRQVVAIKPDSHSLGRSEERAEPFAMSRIGG